MNHVLAPATAPTRTAALWVPDWPVLAALRTADLSPHLPALVMRQNRVVAASAPARAAGVQRGMRKRTAQSLCPAALLLPADEARDAAQFEPVSQAIEQIVSGLEVMRPGLALIPVIGAARYYGGESELVEALVEAVSSAGFECQVGVADGILGAVLAAREDKIIASHASSAYLRDKPISDLLSVAVDPQLTVQLTEAISLWVRLGLPTLGDLVALPSEAMAGRFGQLGVWAQRLAAGQDLRPPAQQRPTEDVSVSQVFDPPLYQVEAAVAVGQQLATQFVDTMVSRSLACGRIRITARTSQGERSRLWRTDDGAIGGMNAANIAQRLRWQLDGWLTTAKLSQQPTVVDAPNEVEYVDADEFDNRPDPILAIEIAAEELAPAGTYQMGLWGDYSGQDVRAERALSNVQSLLGLDQVRSVVLQGERTPWARVLTYAFGEAPPQALGVNLPWPGAVPDPAPSIQYLSPPAVGLLDSSIQLIGVDLRLCQLTSAPVTLQIRDQRKVVTNWAGPWLIPQDWWEGEAVALVVLQVITHDGAAYLLSYGPAGWVARGEYE